MAISNAKLLCLFLVVVAVTVAAHEAQTYPGKGGRLTGGGGGRGNHGVQTLPGNIGGLPSRRPQVQPKPGRFDGRPGNNLKPIGRPTGPLTRPVPRPKGGSVTKPRPRPSMGGGRDRRQAYYSGDSPDGDEEPEEYEDDEESEEEEA